MLHAIAGTGGSGLVPGGRLSDLRERDRPRRGGFSGGGAAGAEPDDPRFHGGGARLRDGTGFFDVGAGDTGSLCPAARGRRLAGAVEGGSRAVVVDHGEPGVRGARHGTDRGRLGDAQDRQAHRCASAGAAAGFEKAAEKKEAAGAFGPAARPPDIPALGGDSGGGRLRRVCSALAPGASDPR